MIACDVSPVAMFLKMRKHSDVLKIIWKSGIRWSLEYSSLYGRALLLLLSPLPPPCQVSRAEPNYPLTNRVQSLVIAFAITIIISITISATYSPLSCQVCLKHLRKVKLDLQNRFGNRNGTFLVHLVRNPIVQHCSFS